MRRRGNLAVIAALLAALAACGGGDDGNATAGSPSPNATAPPGAGEEAGPVRLEASDNAFAPRTLRARAGAQVQVTLVNVGVAPHTFTLREFGADQEVAAGEQKVVTFTPNRPGDYTFVCTFHEGLDMTGTLSVS